jgi:[acyl-carrier-protein] S-malonyltransferase
MKISFVFPGQGSQYVGMGKDLYENFDEVKEIYKAASEALGYDIAGLSFNGPQEELNKTYRTQPCLLTASYAAFKVLTSKGLTPSCMAGHSLGEYSAITASGAISFRDAAILTEKRGRFMQDAVPEGKGLMAAVLGLDREAINKICGSVNSGYVAPANYNCPGQTVIAGEKAAVEEAELLEGIELKYPEIPIVNNADAAFLKDADSIKDSLVRQLNSPLLWEDSIRLMVESGVDSFIEVGPKKVLAGLIKRIDGTVKIYNVEDTKTLEDTLKALT